MALDSRHSFVVLIIGSLPPGVQPGQEEVAVVPLVNISLALAPHVRSTTVLLSGMSPVQLREHLTKATPPTISILDPKRP